MASPAQDRHAVGPRQVPQLAPAERATPTPAVVRTRLHSILHEHLSGKVGIVSRSPKVWQMGLRGERPINLADLAEVATHPGKEARLAILAVAAFLVDVVRPAGEPGSIAEAVAAFSSESSDVAPSYIRAAADGALSVLELRALQREELEAEQRGLRLRAAITAALNKLEAA